MRVAVSGSHSTGKSTLIAAFLERRPDYMHEPEASETLGDDIELTAAGEPTPDSLRALLEYTVSALEGQPADARVVFERSPVDYLAYAEAGRRSSGSITVRRFLATHLPLVRAALRHLDLIAFLPVSPLSPIRGRPGEGARFRRRVDRCLRRALFDDEYGLFGAARAPSIVELPASPERGLAELVRLTARTAARAR